MKYTIETVKLHFEQNGYILLSTEYVNNRTSLKYICKCNEEKEVTYHGFINRKIGCKTCVSNLNKKEKPVKTREPKRVLNFDIIKKEFEDNGCVLISTEYVNNRTPIRYICNCGEETEKTYNCFQYKKGCMKCTGTPKYTYNQVQNFFKEKDCILLSKTYENTGSILDYICSCGNKSKISLSNLLRGHKCRKCRTYSNLYNTEIVKQEFEKYGYTLHDPYVEFDKLMSYTCPMKHNKKISWRKFKNGTRCCNDNQKSEQINEVNTNDNVEIDEVNTSKVSTAEENRLTFNGIFKGRENEIRITPDRMISVFDFIRVVGGQQNPKCTWYDIENKYKNEVALFSGHFQFKGQGQKPTPVINVNGMVKLLFWLPGEMVKKFRNESAETMIRYLGGDLSLINKLRAFNEEELLEIDEVNTSKVSTSEEDRLTFNGIFKGRENEIRITPDRMISVFDFIRVVGGQDNPRKTWQDILTQHQKEVVTFCYNFQFKGQGQKPTPVINVNGMVKLLFWLPGEMAKKFRSESAETMIRYLGGDLSLIDEIKSIDQNHRDNPNNIARVFREEVTSRQNLLFNQDQINISNQLINHFRDKKDVFYMFSFQHQMEWYAKFGIVGELREFYNRILEHQREFEDICFHNVIQCCNIYKVESDFKETSLYTMNKVKIPKKNGGFHVEVLKLSEIVTTDNIKEEMIRVAGDRILDPPPEYSEINTNNHKHILDLEKEKTKQIEAEQQTKQIEAQEKTKQLQIELEILKLKIAHGITS